MSENGDRSPQQSHCDTMDATAGLLYVPEGSGKPHRRRGPVLFSQKQEKHGESPLSQSPKTDDQKTEPSSGSRETKASPVHLMTLSDAFMINFDGRDQERAVRAAALLLDWASDIGNKEVDGFLVMGISRVLYVAADRMVLQSRAQKEE